MVDFLQKSYLTHHNVSGSKYFHKNIRKETIDRILALANYGISKNNSKFIVSALRDNDNKKYNTQMGMRGIQDTIILIPGDDESSFRQYWG